MNTDIARKKGRERDTPFLNVFLFNGFPRELNMREGESEIETDRGRKKESVCVSELFPKLFWLNVCKSRCRAVVGCMTVS